MVALVQHFYLVEELSVFVTLTQIEVLVADATVKDHRVCITLVVGAFLAGHGEGLVQLLLPIILQFLLYYHSDFCKYEKKVCIYISIIDNSL